MNYVRASRWLVVLRAAVAAFVVSQSFAAPPAESLGLPAADRIPTIAPLGITHQASAALPGAPSRRLRHVPDAVAFLQQTQAAAGQTGYLGSLEILDHDPTRPAWEPPPGGQMHVRATIHDADAIRAWDAASIRPGYLDGVEVPEIPLGDTAFEVELVVRQGVAQTYVRFRVARLGGACAVVERYTEGGDVQVPGPWWPVCCASQWLLCELSQTIAPSGCGSCYATCMLGCLTGSSNPCHSCGDCGLSSFLCRFVPGGNC